MHIKGRLVTPKLYEISKANLEVEMVHSRIVQMVIVNLRSDRCLSRIAGVVMLPVDVHETVKTSVESNYS